MFHSTQDSSPSTKDGLLSESTLVLQAQMGDEHAFKLLYELYFDRIHVYLTRMVGQDDIGNELTQETFIRVWRALPALHQAQSFVGWLYRIATNIAYDFQRRTKHVHLTSYDETPTLLNTFYTEGPEDQVEAEELLRIALTHVPWKCRTCLVLYHIQGYSKQYIATLLDIKESSVSTYISLGLEELRQIRTELYANTTVMREGGKNV